MPDPRIPHRLVADQKVEVLVRKPGDPPHKFSKEKVVVGQGWWIASDVLIGNAP